MKKVLFIIGLLTAVVLSIWFFRGYVQGYEVWIYFDDSIDRNTARSSLEKGIKINFDNDEFSYVPQYAENLKDYYHCTVTYYVNPIKISSIIKEVEQLEGVMRVGFPDDFLAEHQPGEDLRLLR